MSTLQLLQHKENSQPEYLPSASSALPCRNAAAGRQSCVDEQLRILSPLSGVLHLVHGPPACVACSWNHSRGTLSSGGRRDRRYCSTDLQSDEMEHGGKKKLYRSLTQLIYAYAPKAAFVYPSCLLDADIKDIVSVCRRVEKENGVSVFALVPHADAEQPQSGGVTACETLFMLVERGEPKGVSHYSINILGELDPGGDAWTIKSYYEQMGVQVAAMITGDGTLDDIGRAQGAGLNVLHGSETFLPLAEKMRDAYGIPYIRESFFGLENTSKALYNVGHHFSEKAMILHRAQSLVQNELSVVSPILQEFQRTLEGKNAGIYVKDAFTACCLADAFHFLGMSVKAIGVKHGDGQAYDSLRRVCDESVLLGNSLSPAELSASILEREVDVFIGDAREQKIMQKLGIGCCTSLDEQHAPLTGYRGMMNFARDVYATLVSPVWTLTPRSRKQSFAGFLLPQSFSKRYQTA